MSKYGKIDMGVPIITEEVAALDDSLAKGLITEEFHKAQLMKLKKKQLTYIARSNGGYTPGKKMIKRFQQAIESLAVAKKRNEIMKQHESRDEFLQSMQRKQEDQVENLPVDEA